MGKLTHEIVPLLSLRDHTRRPCWLGYGRHSARRLERDTCSDVPYQDTRREGLSTVDASYPHLHPLAAKP